MILVALYLFSPPVFSTVAAIVGIIAVICSLGGYLFIVGYSLSGKKL
jgi:hypothetical protein